MSRVSTMTSSNERIELERVLIDEYLWKKSEKEGRIRIGPEGRREVFQALSWFIRHAAAERAWPPAAERIPLERVRSAAEDLLAAIGALDVPNNEIISIVTGPKKAGSKSNTKPKLKAKQLQPNEAHALARKALANVMSNFYFRHIEVVWKRAPETDGGYTNDEFGFRFTNFTRWWAMLAKDVAHVRDTAAESLEMAPRGRRPNAPLIGCVNSLRRVYRSAHGRVAASYRHADHEWSPFIRWMWCLMAALPPDVRPVSIDALGHYVDHYQLETG